MRGILRTIGKGLGIVVRVGGLLGLGSGTTAAAPATPDRPGTATTEYRATLLSQIVGLVVLAAGTIWPDVPAEALREVLVWIGGLLLGVPTAAYSLGRSRVKAAAVSLAAARAAAEAMRIEARAQSVASQVTGRRS